uniref:T9SS type A sorting domain-containing protein n=1 Tax=Roseihalotalea indica TaxID=2867963 RepID=A0AA49GRJ7_9BACT|nr:T9SS type A sorting domain-containing protein [Tunicatimonas sp. TK19036]
MKRFILLLFATLSSYYLNAQVIFEDDFENGTEFKNAWTPRPSTNGRVEITEGSAANGQFGALIGKASDGDFETNALDLTLNLEPFSQVELSFDIRDIAEETHEQDGLYFSDDGGQSFVKVYNFLAEDWCNNYGAFPPFDIDALAAANNLNLTSQFVIRIQQYDNADFNGGFQQGENDGFYIDNVLVRVPKIKYATLPFEDGFEDSELDSAWSWSFPNNTSLTSTTKPTGDVRITTESNNGGQQGLRIGKICDDGFTTNALDLHLNLEGETQVKFSFDIRDIAEETHEQDGLYFSDDGGQSFVKVYNFLAEDWCNNYGAFPPFDIDALAAANNLNLTSQFVIRIQQYDNADFNGGFQQGENDGFYIDNVLVISRKTDFASIPFFDDFETGELSNSWLWSHPDSTTLPNTTKPTGFVFVTADARNTNQFGLQIGKRCDDGFSTSAIDLHLNLAGQSQVEINMDLRNINNEQHLQDGIFFSSNGGKSFTKIYEFVFEELSTQYTPFSLNIDPNLLGIAFSDSSVIRIQQYDNADFNGGFQQGENDGFYIDNVSVQNTKLPFITSFSPGIAPVGREITLTGINMNTVTSVQFAGAAPVTGQALDSVTLLVVVPANAQTGKISVTNEEGTTSSENNFVVSDEEVAAPYELSAEAVSCFITLNWQDTTNNETGFIVERRMVDSTDFIQIATLSANSTSYADEAKVLQNGTEYFYRVRAFSPLGNSAYSNEYSTTAIVSDNCGGEPPTAPPPAPTGLVASTPDREETQLDLNWNAVEGATSYNVYRQVGDNFEQVGSTTETSYTDRGLAFGTKYIYHVRAYNGRESDPSDTTSATTIDKILAIVDDLAEVSELLRLYPNPAQNQLQFTLKNDQYSEVQVRIINTLGQVQLNQKFVKSQPVIEKAMDISHWKSGMYFVEITQAQFRTVQRLAKQ